MLKELLSDLYLSIKPSAQSDSFQPYFSTILTVIAITIILYAFQTVTTSLHVYADQPVSFQNYAQKNQDCKQFSNLSLNYLCGGSTQKPHEVQSLHKPIN